MFHYAFTSESEDERILKISQNLVKLRAIKYWFVFLWNTVYITINQRTKLIWFLMQARHKPSLAVTVFGILVINKTKMPSLDWHQCLTNQTTQYIAAFKFLHRYSLTELVDITSTWHCGNSILSPFQKPLSRWTWVSRYHVSILDFTGAKDDGDGSNNWSYKTCKAPVKSSPSANKHPDWMAFLSPNQHCQSTEGKLYKFNYYYCYYYHFADTGYWAHLLPRPTASK